jgi:hypothetical protein
MDIARAAQIAVLMLSPTLAVGAVLHFPRAVRAVRRFWDRRHVDRRHARDVGLDPTEVLGRPPIEQLAADLRRLLLAHETMRCSVDVAMRARHLHALEAAISDCAVDAARALGLPSPERPVRGPLAPSELRRLLHSLANAGLVLPPAVALLTADKRL